MKKNYPPHKEKILENITLPSMDAVQGITNIQKVIQQEAKAQGCAAFTNSGRVRLMPLLRWVFSRQEGEVNWKLRNSELDARLKEIRVAIELRDLIGMDEAKGYIQELMAVCMGAVKRMSVEFPKSLEHRDKLFIKQAMDEEYRRTLATVRANIEKLKQREVEKSKTPN